MFKIGKKEENNASGSYSNLRASTCPGQSL